MKKEYVITFGISVLVACVLCIVMLMLLLPQQTQVVEGNINKYEAVSKSKYTYETTKDISSENLKKQYGISDEDMAKFKSTKQYKAGNSDPFSETVTDTQGTTGKTTTTSNGTTSTSQNSTQTTEQKTTSSNGGVENPESTGK